MVREGERVHEQSLVASPKTWVVLLLLLIQGGGCVGRAAPLSEPSLTITAHYGVGGIQLVIHATPEPVTDLHVRVRIDPTGTESSYNMTALVSTGNGTYEVPRLFPSEPAVTLVVGAAMRSNVTAFREFRTENLDRDQQIGLAKARVRAMYDVHFSLSGKDGNESYSETQNGNEIVAVGGSGTTTRSFDGTGSFEETLRPLRLHVNLTQVRWIRVDGALTRSIRSGHGTWEALAPVNGSGTVSSFRQEFLGQEQVSADGAPPRSAYKEGITATLNGTLLSNGTSKVVQGTLFWTQFTDVESGKVVWLRQKPADLWDMTSDQWQAGAPNRGIAASILPAILQGRVPVPAKPGDEFTVRIWDATDVPVSVAPETAETILGHPVAVQRWQSSDPGLLYVTSAAPTSGGTPLHWRISAPLGNGHVSVYSNLIALQNGG